MPGFIPQPRLFANYLLIIFITVLCSKIWSEKNYIFIISGWYNKLPYIYFYIPRYFLLQIKKNNTGKTVIFLLLFLKSDFTQLYKILTYLRDTCSDRESLPFPPILIMLATLKKLMFVSKFLWALSNIWLFVPLNQTFGIMG